MFQLVLVVEGKKLYYHQAVVAQHSALLKSLLLRFVSILEFFMPALVRSGCCKCKGEDCRRSSENIFISLSDVRISTVQYVMDIIYAGRFVIISPDFIFRCVLVITLIFYSGNIAGDTEEYKQALDMLGIDTVVVDTVDAAHGFVLEEIVEAAEVAIIAPKIKTEVNGVNSSNAELQKQELKRSEKNQEEIKRKRKEKEEERRKRRKEVSEESMKRAQVREEAAREATASVQPSGPVTHVAKHAVVEKPPAPLPAPAVKAPESQQPDEKDEEIEIIGDSSSSEAKAEVAERFSCPFKDCSSESRTAQSIKVCNMSWR